MRTLIDSWKKKANRYQELKKQKGVTLLEIIIVLGIIGIIAAGVVILAQRAFTAQDMSNLVDNTNSVRIAMTEAYKDESTYPVRVSVKGVTKTNITTSSNKSQIVGLVKMGKIDASEAFNGFSNDAFEIGAGIVSKNGTTSSIAKGFYIAVNGLEQEDCRNLISQIGSQWDYVATVSGAVGADTGAADTVDMTVDPGLSSGILKTLKADQLTPANIVDAGVCKLVGPQNAVVLGSR